MKKKIILYNTLLIFVLSLGAYGQGRSREVLKVTYSLDFRPDSTSTNTKHEEMLLYTDGQHSKFASSNHLVMQDSLNEILVRVFESTGQLNPGQIPMPRTDFDFTIYKSGNDISTFEIFLAGRYSYDQLRNGIKWVLLGEKKTIAGYTCQKATGSFGGRDYEAWYSLEIPVSDGPYKFCGLPGLIVAINDTNGAYQFTLTNIAKKAKYDIKTKPEGYRPVKQTALFQMKAAHRENPMAGLNSLASFNWTREKEQQIIKKEQSKNNPIELIPSSGAK